MKKLDTKETAKTKAVKTKKMNKSSWCTLGIILTLAVFSLFEGVVILTSKLMGNHQSLDAAANPSAFVTVDEIYNNPTNVGALYDLISGHANTTQADLKALAQNTSHTINGVTYYGFTAEDMRQNTRGKTTYADSTNGNKSMVQDIRVTLGGKVWNVCFLSLSGDGKLTLTLMLDDVIGSTAWNPWFANNFTYAYPSNMYGTSLIRAVTNNSQTMGYPATAGATTLTTLAAADDATATYKINDNYPLQQFLTGGTYADLVTTPSQMYWQEIQATAWIGDGWIRKNDAYGQPAAGKYWDASREKHDYLIANRKDHYSDWQYDNLWIPSLSETGSGTESYSNDFAGVWGLSNQQRAHSNQNEGGAKYSWLRSGDGSGANGACCLFASGASYSLDYASGVWGLRPALHCNLDSAALAAPTYAQETVQNITTTYQAGLTLGEIISHQSWATGDMSYYVESNPLTAATLGAAGTYSVTVKRKGWTDKTITVKINPAAGAVQTMPTVNTDTTYDGSAHQIVRTAGSGTGTMKFLVTTATTVPTTSTSGWFDNLENSTNKPTNAGTYYVYGYMTASTDGNYAATAIAKIYEFVIAKQDVTVTINTADWTYGDNVTAPTVTVKGAGNANLTSSLYTITHEDASHIAVADGGFGATMAAGTYTTKVALTSAASENYQITTDAHETWTVARRELTVQFGNGGWVYGSYSDDSQLPSVCVADTHNKAMTLNTDYTVSKDYTEAESGLLVGTYTLTVVLTDTANNYLTGDFHKTFAVTAKPITVSFTHGGWVLGETINPPKASFNGADLLDDEYALSYFYTGTDSTNDHQEFTPDTTYEYQAGAYVLEVNLTAKGQQKYVLVGENKAAYYVANAFAYNVTITYTGSAIDISNGIAGWWQEGMSVTAKTDVNHHSVGEIVDAGTYYLTITREGVNQEIKLTVQKATLNVNLSMANWQAGDTPSKLQVNGADFTSSDIYDIKYYRGTYAAQGEAVTEFTTTTAIGNYTAVATLKEGKEANYNLVGTTWCDFAVTPRHLDLTFNNYTSTWAYGTSEGSITLPEPSFEHSSSTETLILGTDYKLTYKKDGDGADFAGTWDKSLEPGTYTMTVTLTPDAQSKYELAGRNTATITVTRGQLTPEFDLTSSQTYGSVTAPSVTISSYDSNQYTVTYYLNNAAVTVDNWNTATVGTYTIEVTLNAELAAKYELTDNVKTLTIMPFGVNVTINTSGTGWEFGETETDNRKLPTITVDNSLVNIVYTNSLGNIMENFDENTPAGTYTVTITLRDSTNYVLVGTTSATFTVATLPLTVSFTDGGWNFGEDAVLPRVTVHGAAGNIALVTAYYDAHGTEITDIINAPVGTYIMRVSLPAGSNYHLEGTVSKQFTIAGEPEAQPNFVLSTNGKEIPWNIIAMAGGAGILVVLPIMMTIVFKLGRSRRRRVEM